MANEEIIKIIKSGLSPNDWREFEPNVKNLSGGKAPDKVEEVILWQAFYLTEPREFYSLVLPQANQSLYALTIGSKYKNDDIYKAADRIAAASAVFATESKLDNMSKAWDIVARATELAREAEKKYLAVAGHSAQDPEAQRLQAITRKYEAYEQTTFYNILRTRPDGFQVMGALYKDPNIGRRNRRIKKYLFRQSNDQIFARLSKKLEKLDTEGIQTIKKEIQAESATITKNIHEAALPTFEGKGYIGRKIARTANKVIDSGIQAARNKGALETPEISRQLQEADTIFPDDLRFIRDIDKLFGLESRTLKVGTFIPGKPLDVHNIIPNQLTGKNILATTQQELIKTANKNIRNSTEDIADKSKRGARILAAAVVVIAVLVSIGLVIAFPPTLPLVIAANAVILAATGSFVYFNRDPLPKATRESKGLLYTIGNAISDIIPKRSKPPVTFDMPDATKRFLQNLDPDISNQLESHFKNRAKEIAAELEITQRGDKDAINIIKLTLDKLDQDWSKILAAANQGNKQQFSVVVKDYLKQQYENVERPKYIALAQQNKILAETTKKRGNLTFSQEKNRIDELAKIVEKVNRISSPRL